MVCCPPKTSLLGWEFSRVSQTVRNVPLSSARVPLGLNREGSSLTIAPGLSKLLGAGGLWAGLFPSYWKSELGLGQVTALGTGDVARSLLFFSNARGVGFSDCT